jgi:hypothetical protein
MGLQGWDLAAQFGSFDNPNQIMQAPALFRAIVRGDVTEGDVVASRKVSTNRLFSDGEVGFSDNLRFGEDSTEITSGLPLAALGAGRVVLEFVEDDVSSPVVAAVKQHLDAGNKRVASNTDQLQWNYAGRGCCTVDTPGTQAVVGFAGPSGAHGAPPPVHKLRDVEIQLETPFAAVYVTALGRKETIEDAHRVLLTALARTVPEGTVLSGELSSTPIKAVSRGSRRLGRTNPPELIEPVCATISLKRTGPCKVYPLDHAGRIRPDGKLLPVSQAEGTLEFTLDGAASKTMYYLAEFAR